MISGRDPDALFSGGGIRFICFFFSSKNLFLGCFFYFALIVLDFELVFGSIRNIKY
jgi:hypothetical protein